MTILLLEADFFSLKRKRKIRTIVSADSTLFSNPLSTPKHPYNNQTTIVATPYVGHISGYFRIPLIMTILPVEADFYSLTRQSTIRTIVSESFTLFSNPISTLKHPYNNRTTIVATLDVGDISVYFRILLSRHQILLSRHTKHLERQIPLNLTKREHFGGKIHLRVLAHLLDPHLLAYSQPYYFYSRSPTASFACTPKKLNKTVKND